MHQVFPLFVVSFSEPLNYILFYRDYFNPTLAPVSMKQSWQILVNDIAGLMQDCSNSSALAMDLLQFCSKS